MHQRPVASLTFFNQRKRRMVKDAISISPKQEVVLGCKQLQQLVDEDDPTISRRHLILRCVQFDENNDMWNVAPMVYAEDLSMNGTTLARDCIADDGSPLRLDQKLTRSMGPVLLEDGDCLYLNDSTFVQYRETCPNTYKMPLVMSCEIRRLEDQFMISPRLIGAGAAGKVFVAWDHEAGQQVACKAVSLAGMQPDHQTSFENEALVQETPTRGSRARPALLMRKIHRLEVEYDVLKDLNHPNIIDMRRVFVTSHHIYIMQELMAGGDLFSYLEYKGGALGDPLSAVITRQLLKAVEYLHDNGIVHRDIKPENILMSSWESGARIVLTDFNSAKRIGQRHVSASQQNARVRMFTYCGTLGFTAPEVQRLNPTIAQERGYSSAVDMWSVGTVTALMLTGNLAFDHRGSDGEVGQIKSRSRSAYDISTIDQGDYYWEMIAKRARSFVTSLLVLQEDQRLTAKQALEHSWFTHHICAHSFDAVYERSVREWKPRSTSEQDIVVHIDTSDIAIPTPSLSQVVCQPTASSVVQSAFFKGQNNSDQVDMSTNVEEVTEQRLDNTSQLAASPAYPLDARRETFSPNHPPPQSSNPKEDLDRMRPSAQLMNPSIELSWPSSPPNGRGRKRLPSSELPWPTQ